jgi:hypothetical protein
MTTSAAATATFDTAAAEVIWAVMDNAQRAAWVRNIQARMDEITDADADAIADFLTGKSL